MPAAVELTRTNGTATAAPLPFRRGHLEIVDVLVTTGMMGVVTGIACSESHSDVPFLAPVAGHMFTIAFFDIFVEDPQMNPYQFRHPPPPESSLWALKRAVELKTYKHARVMVQLKDGTTRVGRLGDVEGEVLTIRTEAGPDTIQEASIRWIDTIGDSPWDQMIVGAIGGACWGLFATNNLCEGEHVVYISRWRMAAIGAGILGATGLVMDLMHNGKFPLYRGEVVEASTTMEIGPILGPGGPGLGVSLRF